MAGPLAVGEQVRVYGGYDMEPAWLAGQREGYSGTVVDFIPGQNELSAAVVELDEEIALPLGAGAVRSPLVGRFLVLELGHVGTDWATITPRIHVELCADRPERRRWKDRTQGAWVESHATYERLSQ